MIRVRPTKPTAEFIEAGKHELRKYRAYLREKKAAELEAKALEKKLKKARQRNKKSFKFAVYGKAREALTELFKGKCSYCESDFASVMSGDVEHFRPKGGVLVDKKLRPGYYWLAASWDNLLISCKDCNSQRNQRIMGVEGRVLAGKLNQFPLNDEHARARRPRDVANEVPLLLNPYIDNPERYLTYEFRADGDGKVILVKPSKKRGLAMRKAETSIDVYALRRCGLVHSRSRLARKLEADIERLRWFKNQLASNPKNKELESQLFKEIELLLGYTEPDAPYAGMARCLIDPIITEMLGRNPRKNRVSRGTRPGKEARREVTV